VALTPDGDWASFHNIVTVEPTEKDVSVTAALRYNGTEHTTRLKLVTCTYGPRNIGNGTTSSVSRNCLRHWLFKARVDSEGRYNEQLWNNEAF
jgi:hypothetical protein